MASGLQVPGSSGANFGGFTNVSGFTIPQGTSGNYDISQLSLPQLYSAYSLAQSQGNSTLTNSIASRISANSASTAKFLAEAPKNPGFFGTPLGALAIGGVGALLGAPFLAAGAGLLGAGDAGFGAAADAGAGFADSGGALDAIGSAGEAGGADAAAGAGDSFMSALDASYFDPTSLAVDGGNDAAGGAGFLNSGNALDAIGSSGLTSQFASELGSENALSPGGLAFNDISDSLAPIGGAGSTPASDALTLGNAAKVSQIAGGVGSLAAAAGGETSFPGTMNDASQVDTSGADSANGIESNAGGTGPDSGTSILGGAGGLGSFLKNNAGLLAALGLAGGTAASGLLGSSAAQQAAQQQAAAAAAAQEQAAAIYQNTHADLAPFVTGGQADFNTLNQRLPSLTAPFTGAPAGTPAGTGGLTAPGGPSGTTALGAGIGNPNYLTGTPGYQFTLKQGLNSVNNLMASRGGGQVGATGASGNLAAGTAAYTTGLANSTYNQQLQNYMAQNLQAYNMLYQPAALGENAAALAGNVGAGITPTQSTAGQNTGSALASGTVGSTNAATGAINSASSLLSPLALATLFPNSMYGQLFGSNANSDYTA